MKLSIKQFFVLLIPLLLFFLISEGQTFQYFILDSALRANCEQFGIGASGKSEKIKLAVLGPYKVDYIEKLDSGNYRSKKKEGKEISYDSDFGLEEFKMIRFESQAYFRMGLGKDLDSATCLFSYYSTHREKSETIGSSILGSLFNSKEGSADAEYTDQNRLLQGTIEVSNNQDVWRFMLNYPPSYGRINSNIQGYLTDGRDSLRIDFVYSGVSKKSKKDSSQVKEVMKSLRGYTLVDFENRQVAALIFGTNVVYIGAKKFGNYTGGELGIIGNDNRRSAKLAIAAFFSIMVGVQ